jgi:hypothetical protein
MADYTQPFKTTETEKGVLAGPFRQARNRDLHQEGGIHSDEKAQGLGLRGGAVAGSIHFDQFPPLLLEIFGKRWFQTGSLSLYFRYPTKDLEGTRCFARRPDLDPALHDAQILVWMDHENGERVADGTVSVGAPDKNSIVQQRLVTTPPPKDIRIFSSLKVGRKSGTMPIRIPSADMDEVLKVITEPLPDYQNGSAWGKRIASPFLIIRYLRTVQGGLLDSDTWMKTFGEDFGVLLYGAIELQMYKGPVYLDQDYEMRGSILALGETPKTEYYWFDSILRDPGSNDDIVRMTLMMRSMKASHRAWK